MKSKRKKTSLERRALIRERKRFETVKRRKKKDPLTIDPDILVAGIAHEFNNILGAAEGHAQWALDSARPEDMREALEVVLVACKRSAQITSALRGIVQPKEETKTSFALHEVLNELRRVYGPLCERAGIEFRCECPEVTVHGNSGELLELFVNLVKNSIEVLEGLSKAHYPKWIQIRGELKSKKTLQVLFSDSGPGIEKILWPYVFQPFFTTKGVLSKIIPLETDKKSSQSEGSSKLGFQKGGGLGLFLSRKIAAEHGGSLKLIESDHKSAFELLLPLSGPRRASRV